MMQRQHTLHSGCAETGLSQTGLYTPTLFPDQHHLFRQDAVRCYQFIIQHSITRVAVKTEGALVVTLRKPAFLLLYQTTVDVEHPQLRFAGFRQFETNHRFPFEWVRLVLQQLEAAKHRIVRFAKRRGSDPTIHPKSCASELRF